MKIIFAKGQTCNQFWIYTNFIAEALEHKEKIAIWLPDISIIDYPNLTNTSFIHYPLYFKNLAKFIGYSRYIKFVQLLFCNKYAIKFFTFFFKIFSKHEFIVADVFTKKSNYRVKYLDDIRSIFTPAKEVINEVYTFLNSIKIDNSLVIGLHIRYGDYRQFENGKYFYSLLQYREILNKIATIFTGRQIVYFIASSEKINCKAFEGLNYKIMPNCSAAKDLLCLSKVDFLVGPPSTYSAWASLYGNVPIYFIEEIDANIEKDDFVKIQSVWF